MKNPPFLGEICFGVTGFPFASVSTSSKSKSIKKTFGCLVRNAGEDGQWFASSAYTARHWALEGILESTRIAGPNAFGSRKKTHKIQTKRYYMYICIYPRHPKRKQIPGKEVLGTLPQKDTMCIPSWVTYPFSADTNLSR